MQHGLGILEGLADDGVVVGELDFVGGEGCRSPEAFFEDGSGIDGDGGPAVGIG